MKKFLCLMLAMVMALTVVACGKKPQDNSDPKGSDLKIGLISGLTGFGDLSMNDQAKTGCDMCVKEYGVTYKAVEPKDTTQVLDMIQSFAGEGYQIIIMAVPDYDDILADVAPQYPDIQFMTIDSTMSKDNVMAVEYLTHEGSYLAGAAAAMVSKTGVVGAVGGMDLTAISRFIDAYF